MKHLAPGINEVCQNSQNSQNSDAALGVLCLNAEGHFGMCDDSAFAAAFAGLQTSIRLADWDERLRAPASVKLHTSKI